MAALQHAKKLFLLGQAPVAVEDELSMLRA